MSTKFSTKFKKHLITLWFEKITWKIAGARRPPNFSSFFFGGFGPKIVDVIRSKISNNCSLKSSTLTPLVFSCLYIIFHHSHQVFNSMCVCITIYRYIFNTRLQISTCSSSSTGYSFVVSSKNTFAAWVMNNCSVFYKFTKFRISLRKTFNEKHFKFSPLVPEVQLERKNSLLW